MWSGNNNKKYSEVFDEVDHYINNYGKHDLTKDELYKNSIIHRAFWALEGVKNKYENVTLREKVEILMNYVEFDFSEDPNILVPRMVDTFTREIGSLSQKRKYVKELENLEYTKNIDLSKYKKMIIECPTGDGIQIYEDVMSRFIFNTIDIKPMELYRGDEHKEFAKYLIDLEQKNDESQRKNNNYSY